MAGGARRRYVSNRRATRVRPRLHPQPPPRLNSIMPDVTVSPSFNPTSSPALLVPLQLQTAPPNKLAMSRALGAAFLSHQVEQLEKSVSAPRNHNSNSNDNWRDRQRPHPQPSNDSKRGQLPIGGIRITTTQPHQQHQHQQKERPATAKRRGSEDTKKTSTKEADVIVVDASVLVNALGQVKKWCRDGQEEIIIVPLEGTFSIPPLSSPPPLVVHLRPRFPASFTEGRI